MNAHKKHDDEDVVTEEKQEPEQPKQHVHDESCEEYKNKYLRALADYQNLERRVRDERDEIMRSAQARILMRLLPFLDNLEKAEQFIKDPGLKMIKDQYVQELESMGLKTIDVLHKEYDPHLAEALELVEGEKDDMVVEVVSRGYMFNDKVIRPAQVKVSRKKSS